MAPKKQTQLKIPRTRRHEKQEFKNKSVKDDSVLKIGVQQDVKQQHAEKQIHEDRLLDETDKMLRKFDLNYTYGPCVGITRLDRWERAKNLGLNPPDIIRDSLLKDEAHQYQESLFAQFRSI